jgi:hypothetical protein
MPTGSEKLSRDIDVLEAMAAEMATYLDSDVLFWPLTGSLPRLTLGGYLMREHRLLALRHLLSPEEQARLDAAVRQFNEALDERIVRFETKGNRELESRIRQWNEYLKDVVNEGAAGGYMSAVEARLMAESLLNRLSMPPYQLDGRLRQQVASLDSKLHGRWLPGDFIFPDEWQSAYPQSSYWYLYGTIRPR